MAKVVVCETCGTYIDADGLKRYHFERLKPSQNDDIANHRSENPDHILMQGERGDGA